jgi:hypothetical protein
MAGTRYGKFFTSLTRCDEHDRSPGEHHDRHGQHRAVRHDREDLSAPQHAQVFTIMRSFSW